MGIRRAQLSLECVHSTFQRREFSVFARDLDSASGTFVNSYEVRGEVELRAGDRLRIGDLEIQFPGDAAPPKPSGEARDVRLDVVEVVKRIRIDKSVRTTDPRTTIRRRNVRLPRFEDGVSRYDLVPAGISTVAVGAEIHQLLRVRLHSFRQSCSRSLIILSATAAAGSCLGLLVSATAGTSERAMTVLPVLLIGEAVFSGGLARLDGKVGWLAADCKTPFCRIGRGSSIWARSIG